jgi:exodeoxyribonuclease VII small subunit
MPSKSSEPTLQQQLADLDDVLAWFDNPDIDLDAALQKFDHGVKLAESAKAKLTQLENKITVLKQRFNQPA